MATLRAALGEPDVVVDGVILGEALGELDGDLNGAALGAALDMKALAKHWEQR